MTAAHWHGRHVGTTGDTMTGLPASACPPSIIGTGTAAGKAPALARSMTSLPGVSFPLELAGVDRRHHGRHGRHDDRLAELPGVSFPASIVGTTGTAARCQVDDRDNDQLARRQLPAVDHRHHGNRGTLSGR